MEGVDGCAYHDNAKGYTSSSGVYVFVFEAMGVRMDGELIGSLDRKNV